MTSSPKDAVSAVTSGGSCGNSFQGRRWLLREAQNCLSQDLPTNGGIVVYGHPGTGKTELLRAIAGSA